MMLLHWVCALMEWNLTWLSMFVLKSFCSFQHLSVDVFLNLTVVFLMLPAFLYEYQISSFLDHRSLRLPGWHKRLVSAYNWWQSRIVSSWADCLLLLCNTHAMTGTPGSSLSTESLHWTVLLVAYFDLFCLWSSVLCAFPSCSPVMRVLPAFVSV